MSLYAVNAGWTVREFVANAQFHQLAVNAFSLVGKGSPQLTTPAWLLAGAGIAVGAVIGKVLADRAREGLTPSPRPGPADRLMARWQAAA